MLHSFGVPGEEDPSGSQHHACVPCPSVHISGSRPSFEALASQDREFYLDHVQPHEPCISTHTNSILFVGLREALAEMRALDGQRRDFIRVQTRQITRLRGLLLEVFLALEATLNLNRGGALLAVTKVATPASISRPRVARLTRWLKGCGVRESRVLAQRIGATTKAQKCELPAAEVKASLFAEIAFEVLRGRRRIAARGDRLEEFLASNQRAGIVRSLPGIGMVFAAVLLAEVGELSRFNSVNVLAAAAELAPVLRASGSVSHLRRPKQGNRKTCEATVLHRSAFCALYYHKASESSSQKKRGHHSLPGGDRASQAKGQFFWGRCCATEAPTVNYPPKLLDKQIRIHQSFIDPQRCTPAM